MRLAIFAALALALLGGLWAALRPQMPPVPSQASVTGTPAEVTAAPAPGEPVVRRFEIALPLAAGTARETLRVQAGEIVELVVTGGGDDELHLHGYDLAVDLHAGKPGTLRFVAEHAGRFDLELHHGHAEIAVLEVTPR